MKAFDKIILVLFSCIVLVLSILSCFVIFGWIPLEAMIVYVKYILINPTSTNIALGAFAVFIILAIKGIFFISDTKTEKNSDNGILIQNENGKLFISKDTIQNLISSAVKEVEGAQDVSSRVVLTKTNDINVDVVLFVMQDVMIKDLSNTLQLKIKDLVKKSMDIDIKEVNIKIKNITTQETKD